MTDAPRNSGRYAIEAARANDGDGLLALDERRRIGFGVAISFAAIILASNWVVREAGDWFIEWIYPTHAVALAVLVALLFRRSIPLSRLVVGGYIVVANLALSRLVWHFVTPGVSERMVDLAGGLMLGLAAVVVASFVVFDLRRGLMMSIAIVTLSLAISLVGLWTVDPAGAFPEIITYQLIRAHLFLLGILALASGVAVVHDTHRRVVTRAELLGKWASTDGLTGIANRRAGETFLRENLERAYQTSAPLAVALLDIDRFKVINDDHGHAIGDDVLSKVADTLASSLRGTDLVARWGGEEFLIISPGADSTAARRLAERCRQAIEGAEFAGIRVTATFGVSARKHGDTPETLVSRADRRLYAGKEAGRNRVVTTDNGTNPTSADADADTDSGTNPDADADSDRDSAA